MPSTEKVKPIPRFVKFLEQERKAVARLAESQPLKKRLPRQQYYTNANSRMAKFYKCVHPAHRKDNINHTTNKCKEFQKLPLFAVILTKRIVLQQVMKIYDPLGLVSPFTLI